MMCRVSWVLDDTGHILIYNACSLHYAFFLKELPVTILILHQGSWVQCATIVQPATCDKQALIDKAHKIAQVSHWPIGTHRSFRRSQRRAIGSIDLQTFCPLAGPKAAIRSARDMMPGIVELIGCHSYRGGRIKQNSSSCIGKDSMHPVCIGHGVVGFR